MTLEDRMLAEYKEGKSTVAEVAKKYGISTGKAYYILRDLGCTFIKTRRKPFTEEERLHRSQARKGWKMGEEQKKMISERNSCNYNGLNGYGHVKKHCKGYILAYAPLHPHAHADGYVMLHTVVMEQHIGRYLEKDEVVHHINHDRTDNRIENLKLMNKKEHASMHMVERHAKRRNDLSIA